MDWKSIVKQIAPALGAVLGGPAAGIAVKYLSDNIFPDKNMSDNDISNEIMSANPELLLKIKQIDNDFKIKMIETGIDLEKLAVDDRASARSRQVSMHDWTPNVLALLIIAFYGVMLYCRSEGSIRVNDADIGALQAMVMLVLGYFFGSMFKGEGKK